MTDPDRDKRRQQIRAELEARRPPTDRAREIGATVDAQMHGFKLATVRAAQHLAGRGPTAAADALDAIGAAPAVRDPVLAVLAAVRVVADVAELTGDAGRALGVLESKYHRPVWRPHAADPLPLPAGIDAGLDRDDVRRAAALLAHIGPQDATGLRMAIAEADQAGRTIPLIRAVIGLLARTGLLTGEDVRGELQNVAALYTTTNNPEGQPA